MCERVREIEGLCVFGRMRFMWNCVRERECV